MAVRWRLVYLVHMEKLKVALAGWLAGFVGFWKLQDGEVCLVSYL